MFAESFGDVVKFYGSFSILRRYISRPAQIFNFSISFVTAFKGTKRFKSARLERIADANKPNDIFLEIFPGTTILKYYKFWDELQTKNQKEDSNSKPILRKYLQEAIRPETKLQITSAV